jgi:HTH-type transcriptional regulator, sugar sensing transcriptional regulator
MAHRKQLIERLRQLGFTELEAEVYLFLVANEAMTAYRVGRLVGRATANVYKAIEALARRGAVLVEDGDARLCRAVPPKDLLDRLAGEFASRVAAVREELASFAPPAFDERVYRLETPAQVLECSERLLAECTDIAVVDAFPRAVEALRPALERTLRRGVEVFVEAYAPFSLPGATVAVFSSGAQTLDKWRSEQLNLVVDGRQHVAALMNTDLTTVLQAVWSRSLYLSCLMHAGRLSEHTLVRCLNVLGSDGGDRKVRRLLRNHRFFIRNPVPGQRDLLQRLQPAAAPGRPAVKRR